MFHCSISVEAIESDATATVLQTSLRTNASCGRDTRRRNVGPPDNVLRPVFPQQVCRTGSGNGKARRKSSQRQSGARSGQSKRRADASGRVRETRAVETAPGWFRSTPAAAQESGSRGTMHNVSPRRQVGRGISLTPGFRWHRVWIFQEATPGIPNVWHMPAGSNQMTRLSLRHCCWAKKPCDP